MAIETQAIRLFGPEQGVAAVRVRERIGTNRIPIPRRGAVAVAGNLKRGPMGVFVPVSSKNQYDEIFGDKRDPRWALYADNSQHTPDAIDGFFAMANGEGVAFILRLDLEGKAKKASLTSKNPLLTDVLRVNAANEGQWGGREQHLPNTPVVYATAKTFTLYAPGVESNEFLGAKAYFSKGNSKGYEIIANTAADEDTGEAVFTLSPQFDLVADGVSGPVALSGIASYNLKQNLTGTISYTAKKDLTGTVSINGRTVTGSLTIFTQELDVGDTIYYQGEARVIDSISSDTTLTVRLSFSQNVTNVTAQTDNLVVEGIGTDFTTIQDDLIGKSIYVSVLVNGEVKEYSREVASVQSDTELTLDSGFPVDLGDSGFGATTQIQVDGATTPSYNTTFTEIDTAPTNIPTAILDSGAGEQLVTGSPILQAGSRYILHVTDNTGTAGKGWVIYDTATIDVGGVWYVEAGGFSAAVTSPASVAAWNDDQGASVGSLSLTETTLAAGAVTAQRDNYWVYGDSNTDFANELVIGDAIVDPNRSGETVLVSVVDAINSRFKVDRLFPGGDFGYSQLVKQSEFVKVDLEPVPNQGLEVEYSPGSRYPLTHFGMKVYFNKSLVLNIPDASLDPNDALYVEQVANEANIAYREGSVSYQSYVTVESLWTGSYTTAETNDVRPVNGAGKALEVEKHKVYTIGEFDYEKAVGNPMHPRPYTQPREIIRIDSAAAPVDIEGTVSSLGVDVTGVGTQFEGVFAPGDYLYDPNTGTVRQVRLVTSNTTLVLFTAFATDIPALTETKKAGYLTVNRGTDLTKIINPGSTITLSYPEQLKGGYDGDLGFVIPYHYTKFFDVEKNLLERAVMGKNLGLVRLATPGVSDIAVIKQVLLYAERRAFEYRAEVPSFYTPAAADSFINEDMGRNDFTAVAYPSYGFISDSIRGGKRLVPLTGDIMGLESYQASIHDGYHVPAAGVEARLSRVTQLPYIIDTGQEADLTIAGFQPLKKVNGSIVIFGAECPALDPTYAFLHVRRTQSDYVRIFLEAMPLLRMLFKPNQPNQAEQLRMILGTFMREEYRKGALNKFLTYEQAVQIWIESPQNVGSIATSEDSRDVLTSIANGELNAHINYVPAGVIKNLYVNLGPDLVTASYGSITG